MVEVYTAEMGSLRLKSSHVATIRVVGLGLYGLPTVSASTAGGGIITTSSKGINFSLRSTLVIGINALAVLIRTFSIRQ